MIKKKIDVEHSSGMIDPQGSKDNSCVLKFTSLVVFGLAKCLGLLPFNYDGSDKRGCNFKFFSVKTLLSFLSLFIFTFPALILPNILYIAGLLHEDFKWGDFLAEFIFAVEYFVNFLVFVLPFAFAKVAAKPLAACNDIWLREHSLVASKSVDGLKGALIPIIAFVLFLFGKLLKTISVFQSTEIKDSIQIYCDLSVYLFAHFPLHFLLASYEFFFYRNLNHYQALADRTLNTDSIGELFAKVRELTIFMVKTQEALGFFLLIDLGLMLLFWLIHTYMAFFTFQVQDSYQIIVYDKQRGPSFAELDVRDAFKNVLADFAR